MTAASAAQAALQARIDAQPRVRIAHLPTPLVVSRWSDEAS
jgi:hypothetical protein